ncbi:MULTISPECIES: phage holin family protein [Prolixibacter]|uniref:Membrane protein n=1 Tax=Prolixibacter denitrificans TaxID=1541063 RepID=A0A2P8CD12_9BACT|nr:MULTISPECIES: phage holin family protein [Prolixibacter]PSK82855.1 putative membrane protein [Prolixibacter denitrificans]GET21330.1 membrane protein [Prolixibacter denitrificans]GET23868.1 membrane protein [Prolixibacter sp. NT017]
MNVLAKILINTIAVLVVAYILPGIEINSFFDGLVVAVVLALLNLLVKPVLVILTLPLTIVTLGIFLLILNGLIVMLAGALVDGFYVSGLFWAIIFSLLVSLVNTILGAKDLRK